MNSSNPEPHEVPFSEPEITRETDHVRQYSDFLDVESKAIDVEEKDVLSKTKTSTIQLGIAAASVVFALALGVMIVHYLGPTDWHWLSDEQLDKLESLFSGSGATYILVTLTRRFM